MTTAAFAQQLLAENPLSKDGVYIPQTHGNLSDSAAIIWDALKETLKPFVGDEAYTLACRKHVHCCRIHCHAKPSYAVVMKHPQTLICLVKRPEPQILDHLQ